jgi:hypothetical protein
VVIGIWETFDGFGNEAIVVRLNQPIVAGRFMPTSNFRIIGAGTDGVLGTGDDVRVAIGSAVYNPRAFTITMNIARSSHPFHGLALVDVGAAGVFNRRFLHLAGRGIPGTDFTYRLDI